MSCVPFASKPGKTFTIEDHFFKLASQKLEDS